MHAMRRVLRLMCTRGTIHAIRKCEYRHNASHAPYRQIPDMLTAWSCGNGLLLMPVTETEDG